ncbi:uncharacterized protein At4g15970-like [Selaginella moellendorffii]|uniref:uncharacterized protein At4g15970-like n=1 Tax=Selaginella moellendorffii TaxID=88036 RepID=UPI000D1C89BC|nr:uncharacterized protein At4g15970-like [Selaginella moellendorffii]|eukprot:XP_024542703.1 uncharacterized protein At4g15970-like [Selaginella moellendorffii]
MEGTKKLQQAMLPAAGILCTLVFLCLVLSFSGDQARDQAILEEKIGVTENSWLAAHASNSSTTMDDGGHDPSKDNFDFQSLSVTSNFSVKELQNLNKILHRAQFHNKTVILTTLNQAWAENNTMIDLFLDGFHKGIETERFLPHLVIIALDSPSFQRCAQIHRHCFLLRTDGINFAGEQKRFMTPDYLEMMWRRIYFLRVVLQLGYSFVFTDADILWFRDPFPQFHPVADFEIASDHFTGIDNDLNNAPNGGFVHAVSGNRTIALYALWYDARLRFPGRHDQDVLNDIKFSPEFSALGLRLRFLSTEFFGGFCERPKDLGLVCTMHANCCGAGLENKLQDLQLVAEDWNLWKFMTQEQRDKYKIEWRVPRHC